MPETAGRPLASHNKYPGADVVKRRHVDWLENRLRWQWMLDSYEGGGRYRDAVYGRDRAGLPVRNLLRHKREYPDPREYPGSSQGTLGALGGDLVSDGMAGIFPGIMGADPHATAGDDDYEMRRARTPPPEFVSECVEHHLAKIYDQEVDRQGPAAIADPDNGWWADVDGCGTTVDDWMTETIAPLLLVFGFLDVMFDRPAVPEGEKVGSQADVLRLKLDRCVAAHLLPENMLWYRLDAAKQYAECLILEYIDPALWDAYDADPKRKTSVAWTRKHIRFRHWTCEGSILYDVDGAVAEPFHPHGYGRPPVVRVFDRKKHRTPNVGKSRYEVVAEIQRECYNRDSELIMSDTLQAFPLLQGPEDFVNADGTVPIGPGWLLPKKRNNHGGAVTYEGFDVVNFPKDGAESIRQNKMDLIEAKDRAAYLTKPAGSAGSAKGTVGQSGVSKVLDGETGNRVLSKLAKILSKAERAFAEFALLVCLDREPTPAELAAIKVVYPSRFDLFDLDELAKGVADLQALAASTGDLPEAEILLIQLLERKLLRNLDDDTYQQLDDEVKAMVAAKSAEKSMLREGASTGRDDRSTGRDDRSNALGEAGGADTGAQTDPTGVSSATAVSSSISATF